MALDENIIQHKWVTTFLATVGAALTVALLIWIASNQVQIITSQAVLQRDFQAQSQVMNAYYESDRAGDLEVKEWFRQIWSRLRAHGENVSIMKRVMEDICACDVELKEPERF